MGSIARILLRQLVDSGALKNVEQHSKQGLYTPIAVAADKVIAAPVEKDGGKGKGQAKKPTKDTKWLVNNCNLKIWNELLKFINFWLWLIIRKFKNWKFVKEEQKEGNLFCSSACLLNNLQ